MTIPENATRMPTHCMKESAIPVIAQISTLTMTALKLITAETGPVGPSLRARMTNISARTKAVPAGSPVYKVSTSIYSSRGILIKPKAESTIIRAAHAKSVTRFSFKKVRGERMRVQYLAILMRVPSITIDIAASVTIERIAVD